MQKHMINFAWKCQIEYIEKYFLKRLGEVTHKESADSHQASKAIEAEDEKIELFRKTKTTNHLIVNARPTFTPLILHSSFVAGQ